MTESESMQSLESTPCKSTDYKLGINNITHQIFLAKDGEAWCALLGQNLQNGLCGFGNTMPEALRDLANKIQNYE